MQKNWLQNYVLYFIHAPYKLQMAVFRITVAKHTAYKLMHIKKQDMPRNS